MKLKYQQVAPAPEHLQPDGAPPDPSAGPTTVVPSEVLPEDALHWAVAHQEDVKSPHPRVKSKAPAFANRLAHICEQDGRGRLIGVLQVGNEVYVTYDSTSARCVTIPLLVWGFRLDTAGYQHRDRCFWVATLGHDRRAKATALYRKVAAQFDKPLAQLRTHCKGYCSTAATTTARN